MLRTLKERFEGKNVEGTVFQIRKEAYDVLYDLLSGTAGIHIPRWNGKADSTIPPDEVYTAKRSETYSSQSDDITKSPMLFIDPYDPIIFLDSKKKIVAIMDTYVLTLRDIGGDPFLPDQVELIAKDPIGYCEKIGELYGRCIVCGKTLKAAESIERSIGPVCYARVKSAQEITKKNAKDDVFLLAEARDSSVGLVDTYDKLDRYLYPMEETGLAAINNKIQEFFKAGFIINPFGQLTVQPIDSPIPCTVQREQTVVILKPIDSSDSIALCVAIGRIFGYYFQDKFKVFQTDYDAQKNTNKFKQAITVVETPKILAFDDIISHEKTPILPTKASAHFTVEGSHILLYKFPQSVKQSLFSIPGAKYDAKKKRLFIPSSNIDKVKDIVNLIEDV
jgi:hypothetical protein